MRRSGYTLVEMLVAGGMLLLLLGFGVGILAPSLRIWMRSRWDAEAQQATAVVAARLRDEVRAAHGDSVSVIAAPPAVAVVSWKGPDGSAKFNGKGDFVWQKRVILYFQKAAPTDRVGVLRVHEIPLPADADKIEPLKLPSFTPGERDPVLAHGIRNFQLDLDEATGVLQFTVEAEIEERRSILRATAGTVIPPEPTPSPEAK